MCELASEQQQVVEKAMIGQGKYKLQEEYKHLKVSETKWFAMSQDQRSKHLKRFQQFQSQILVQETVWIVSSMKSSTCDSTMKFSLQTLCVLLLTLAYLLLLFRQCVLRQKNLQKLMELLP